MVLNVGSTSPNYHFNSLDGRVFNCDIDFNILSSFNMYYQNNQSKITC